MMKRILSLLLSIVMLITMLPVQALAEDMSPEETTAATEATVPAVETTISETTEQEEAVPETTQQETTAPTESTAVETTATTEATTPTATEETTPATTESAVTEETEETESVEETVLAVQAEDLTAYSGKVISILGGSTCTFAGYIPEDDGFNLAHRARYPQDNLLTDVDETWWMQLITQLDAKLGINDSWAGSQVLNTMDGNSGDLGEDAAMASLTRIQNLGSNGTPDVILFYGAMNDIGRAVTLGTFTPDTAPTKADLTATKWESLADAYVAAILRLQHYYPDTRIVSLLPSYTASYYTEAELETYGAVLKAVCDHYGVPTIDLRKSGLTTAHLPDGIHPNAEGMDHLTAYILEQLSSMTMEAGENVVYSVTHDLMNASASLGYYKGVSAGKAFEETISGENLAVTITMGGTDITASCYANNQITIPAVTGDLVITVKAKFSLGDRLQQISGNICAGTNLWTALVPVNEYYTASGWGTTGTGLQHSVTFPVTPGDRIWATSFGTTAVNGMAANGTRITWFSEDGVLESLTRDKVYAEFAESGYITVPPNAVALNIPMASNSREWEIYIQNLPHSYENGLCTACGEGDSTTNHRGKVISILGDSISTFAGYIPVADGFNLEHLARYPQDNLLTDVNETWWMQVIRQLDAKLGINDSWRGATVSGAAPVTSGTTGENAAMANLTRIQNLGSNGTPDVILFYGGTNDLAHVSKVGTFDKASAPDEVDLTTAKWDNLADGYVHTLLRLQYYYPDALIVALLPTYTASYYADTKLEQANKILAEICDHYGVLWTDLRDSGVTADDLPDGIHPGAEGMDLITNAVLAVLEQCDTAAGDNIVHPVTHSLTNVKASMGHYRGISDGKPFSEVLTADNALTVTVTMGGTDITAACYSDGKISIPRVTGDLVITAKAVFSLGERLQELPEDCCGAANLWTALEHHNEYYNGTDWAPHASGVVRSATVPVTPGDRLWATSFGASGENGGNINGIRLTWFGEEGVLKSVGADAVYAEFAANGFITVPEGANAANVVMWNSSESNEFYILNLPHSYESVVTAPTCTEQGYTTLVCENCGDTKLETQTMDITDLFTWTSGKMIIATSGACQDYADWQASDYVDVSSFDSIQILTANTIHTGTTTGLAFYDVNKKYISGVRHTDGVGKEYGTLLHTLEIPENAAYVRSTWYLPTHPNYSSAFGEFSCMATGQYVPAIGHSYEQESTTAPTCTAQGTTVFTCSVCADSYTETVNRLEHTYDDGVCTVCGVSILGSDWIAPDFAEGDYTMVVLPDTQILVQYWPEIYYNQMQWIADNKDTLNIQAVLHMGDMVNNNNDTEWTVCEAGTDIIDTAGISWMPMRGNHDDSAWFNKYYDYATYGTDQSWFGGSYEEGKLDHTYWFVTVGEREYMILSLGWAPSWDVLAWAQSVVQEHDDKSVILACHAYMNKDGTLLDKGDAYCVSSYLSGYPDGDDVWAAFEHYGNVVLAMGGHIHSADLVTWVGQNGAGQDVASLLVDRQDDDTKNRYAMIALLTFHADSDTVDINWYSTRYDALYRAKNQFSITVPDVCEHNYTSAIVKPTCTESGGTKYTCTICGHIYWENQVSALGHSYENNICETCGLARMDLTGQFTDWTEGGPVLFRNGYGYGEEGFPDGPNPNLKYSGYISVEGIDTLELTVCARKGHSATGGYAFYTDKGTEYFISEGASTRNGNGAAAEGTVIHTIAVPEGAKYIRVTYWSENSSYSSYPFSFVGYTTDLEELSLRYDDHYDVTGKTVEIIDAGTPTVISQNGNYLSAVGVGVAMVRIDGQLYEITVHGRPVDSFKGKTISILGDSISTYTGVSNDAAVNATLSGGAIYYTPGRWDVYREDTWWQQTIDALGLELLVNNSWSGSCIFNTRSGTVGAYIDRCVQLHNTAGEEPDIVAVYLGTNDFCNFKSTLGTAEAIDYDTLISETADGYVYADPVTAAEAYAIMLHKMTVRYPDAEVYCFTLLPQINQSAANVKLMKQFNDTIERIATHYGAYTVDLYNDSGIRADEFFQTYVADNSLHPGPAGMDAITGCFVSSILENSRYSAGEIYDVTYDLTDVIVDQGTAGAVRSSAAFEISFTTPVAYELTVNVTMGGVDITEICYSNGKIAIESVIGDIHITATAAMPVKEPENYRWEFDGTDFVNIVDNENSENAVTRLAGSVADGVHTNGRYQLAQPIVLYHDRPWCMEWKSEGTWQGTGEGALLFAEDKISATVNAQYFYRRKNNELFAFGVYNGSSYQNYGVVMSEHGLDCSAEHTYRMENRVAKDVSNMIWLYVDGAEIGPMNQYFVNGTNQNTTSDWVSGKNFVFSYLGGSAHPINNCSIDYIQVWEGGAPEPDFTGKTISILGDSISTYSGVSDDAAVNATLSGGAIYYTPGRWDVYREDTWWQQTIDALGLELLVNNSWSGSCVLPTRSGTVGAYIDRCVQLHNSEGEEPDIIAVFLGTNDFSYYQSTLGTADIDYAALITDNGDSTFAYADPVTTCEAYAIMLHKMTQRYPDAEIYCMTLTARRDPDQEDSYADVGQPTAFNAQLSEIIEHFGCTVVNLEGCGIDKEAEVFDQYMGDSRVHPNAEGMDLITQSLVSAMLGEATEVYDVAEKLTNVTMDSTVHAVLAGGSYSATLTPESGYKDLTVSVTMDGTDITGNCWSDGQISIPLVTGDIVITAEATRDPLNFRWEFDGSELVCVSGGNDLTKMAGTVSGNVIMNAYYQMQMPVILGHDQPWVVEWKASGSWSGMLLSANANAGTAGNNFLFKTTSTSGFIGFGERVNSNYENYGVALEELGVNTSAEHVYRLENRVASDGTNIAYLTVDGTELGAMNHYYIGGTNDQKKTVDWLNGRDFVFSYIGASGHTLNNCALEYLAVWEGGAPAPEDIFSEDYLAEIKDISAKVKAAQDGSDSHVEFIVFTDLHKDSVDSHPEFYRMMDAVDYLASNLDIRFAANLGDILDTPVEGKNYAVYDEVKAHLEGLNVPFVNITGNHDWISANMKRSMATNVEGAVFDNVGSWFYFDDAENGIRYIALDCQDRGNDANDGEKVTTKSSGVADRSWQQLDWFANVALKTTNKVIILEHQSLGSTQKNVIASQSDISNYVIAGKIAQAFVEGTAGNSGYTLYYPEETTAQDAVEWDFTEQGHGTILFNLHGHGHGDLFWNHTTTNASYFNEIAIDDALCSTTTYIGANNVKTIDTVNEIAFDIVSVDYEANTVTCFRFGAGEDRIYQLEYPEVVDLSGTQIDMTGLFTDWTIGGPVGFATGAAFDENSAVGSNANLKYSDYISVEGLHALQFTVCARKGNAATGGYAFYTDKGTEYFISEGASTRNGNGAAAEGTVVHTIAIPEGAKYIRVSYWVDSTSYAAAVPFRCVGYTDHVHIYTSKITAPTCTEQGYTTYTCTCGDSYVSDYTDLKIRPITSDEVEQGGYYYGRDSQSTTRLRGADPIYVEAGTIVKYSANGLRVFFAIVSGPDADRYLEGGLWYTNSGEFQITTDGYLSIIISKLNPEEEIAVSDYTADIEIHMIAHDYEAVMTQPTYTQKGYTTHTCTICGNSYVDSYVDVKPFEILLIGNSFSEDAMRQFRTVAKAMLGENACVEVHLAINAGKTIAWHATQAEADAGAYKHRYITEQSGGWVYEDSPLSTLSDLIQLKDWSVVTLQSFYPEVNTGVASGLEGELAEFLSMEASVPFMLDYINQYAPQAKIYYYMAWQSSQDTSQLDAGRTEFEQILANTQTLIGYSGTNSGRQFDGVIPVGTAIQNARSTYLGMIDYADVNGSETVIGLQRDSVHLAYTFGGYIGALAFAEYIFPENVWVEGYTLPMVQDSSTIGALPEEYTEITQKAVAAALNNPYSVTALSGYETDPADAAKIAIEGLDYDFGGITTEVELIAAIEDQVKIQLNKAGFGESTITVESYTLEDGAVTNLTATVTFRFGYTTRTANIVKHTHAYESVVTAPTCTEQGYTTYTCECGDSYENSYVDALGHSYQGLKCTLCGAEHPNAANYAGKVISIMGDSISTFAGYIPVADGFNLEHLSRYPDVDRIPDVTEAEQTWWMQVITELDAKLGINDSWRGAMVSGAAAVTTGTTGPNAAMSNLQRIRNLGANGTPDVILFYGGTNDYAHLSAIGTFDPAAAPVEADLTTTSWNNLADAYVQTLLRLRHYYPDAVIVAMLPTYTASYYSDTKLSQGNAVLAEICAYYGIPCVDLRSSGVTAAHLPDGIHPGAEGMNLIADAVVDLLLSQCNSEAAENVVYSVTHDLSDASASLGYFKGVTHGTVFSESLTGDDLDVTVTMGGMDITALCYADGKITISSVTGDLVITAKGRFNADGHLQMLPEELCCGTNLWSLMEHDKQYYTVDGWGIHNSGHVYSVTFPVSEKDRIYATSFGAGSVNGSGSTNGIRVTYFFEDGSVRSLSADTVYSEFSANGYLTMPAGVLAVSVPMWRVSDSNELYILSAEHDFESVVTAPTCTEKGFTTHTCTLCGDSYVSDETEALGHDYSGTTCTVCGNLRPEESEIAWEIGTIASATGLNSVNSTRLRTVDYLLLEEYGGVGINRGYTMTNFVYDKDYNYLGTSSWLGSGIGFETEDLQEQYPDAVYFRIALRTEDSKSISVADIEAFGVTFYGPGEDVPVRDDVIKHTVVGNIGSWQDGAIFDGKLFVFGSSGSGAIYDLGSLTKLGTITLDRTDVLNPHANSVCFGSTYYAEGDQYPLLYINIYNNYASSADRMEGTCCVYRLTEMDGVFTTDLVQVIRIGFVEDLALWKSKENDGDTRPYGNFIVDTDNNKLYAYVMRDANSTTRFFRFDLPTLTDGAYNETYGCNVVTLESSEIETYFDTSYFNYLQGGCYFNDQIISVEGFSNGTLRIVDLDQQKLSASHSLGEAGLLHEPEVLCTDPATGILYYAAADGILRKLTIPGVETEHTHSYTSAVTAPTCTEQGYTTYSCACGDSYIDSYVDALGHDMSEGVVTNEPTCTETGEQRRDCSRCDHFEEEEIPANGHSYEAVVIAPTCTEKGYTTHTCTACGDAYTDTEMNALGHIEIVDEAVAPTCTEPGLTEGKHCSVCNEVLTAQTVVKANGHTEEVDKAVAPTCTETGVTEGKHCLVCGEILVEQTVVDPLGHTEVIDAAVAATCTETGLTEGKHCSVCSEVLLAQEVLEPMGHDYENHICRSCGEAAPTGGQLGEDLSWKVDTESGELILSGNGAVSDLTNAPWTEYADTVTSVAIGDGVTSIGGNVFEGLDNLTSVTIPDSVTEISEDVFANCGNLEQIIVSDGNTAYADLDRILFSKNLTELLKYPGGRTDAEYTIPETVTEIAENAFTDCDNLEKLTFTGSAPEFADNAFHGFVGIIYYPGGDPTWTEEIRQNYGGSITWSPVYESEEVSEIQADKLVLQPGESVNLTAVILPGVLPVEEVVWSLEPGDEAYAELNPNGRLASVTAKPVIEAQTITVTARTPDGVAEPVQIRITILPMAESISIAGSDGKIVTETTVWFNVGEADSLTFHGDIRPADAPGEILWNWSDSENAYASYTDMGDGAICISAPTGTTGTVTLTAVSGELTAKVDMKFVSFQIDGEEIEGEDPADINLFAGKSKTLKVYDADTGKALTSKQITWSLAEEYAPFATITKAGKLTARKVVEKVRVEAVGTIVSSEGATVTVKVDIFPTVTQVEIFEGSDLVNGKTIPVDTSGEVILPDLTAKVYPTDAMEEVTWKSSSKKIVDIDPVTGQLTWMGKNGTVTITATANDGSKKKATVKLTFGTLAEDLTIGIKNGKQITAAEEAELISGKSLQLAAELTGNPTNKKVTWSLENSADSAYVKLSTSGKVTAKTVYEERTVIVKATAADGSGATDTFNVKILPKDAGILVLRQDGRNVTKSTVYADMNTGGTVTLTAHNLTNADTPNVEWKSSKASIATVENGIVTFAKAGSVTITATDVNDGRKATVTVKATQLASKVTITGATEVASGKAVTLKATAENASSSKVTWSITKGAAYAKITNKGKLTANKDITSAVEVEVTATAADGSGKFGTAIVTIRPIAQGVQIYSIDAPTGAMVLNVDSDDSSSFLGLVRSNTNFQWAVTTLAEDGGYQEKLQLNANVYPYEQDAAMNAIQGVTWKSSSKKVATVDENGLVTCLKAGSTTITATAKDGSGKKATFKLTVVKKTAQILLEDTYSVSAGKKLTLKPVLLAADGTAPTDKRVEYKITSRDGAAHASISQKGVLTTKKSGASTTVEVTVTALDGSGISKTCTVEIQSA